MVPLSLAQLSAYADAVYEVDLEGSWADVRTFAPSAYGSPATLISACNPWSQLLSDAENAQRNHGLYGQIETSRHDWYRARGRSVDLRWIEPGFLVLAPLDLIDVWARQWQQHAVLVLRGTGQSPALRLYSPFAGDDPPPRLANMHLEWVGCGPPASS